MGQTKIGLSMLFCLGEGFPLMVKHLEELETHYIELVDDGLHMLDDKRAEALNRIAGALNIEYTVHAPLADINIAASDRNLRRFVMKRLEKSMQFAHQLDCLLWIFHPGSRSAISSFYPGLDWQVNLESIRTLLALGRKYNVRIAIENIPEIFPSLLKSVNDFSKLYEQLGEDIGMVLDVGHANVNGQTEEFMDKFGDKIVHIHVSDNDGKQDSHFGIGKGCVDWQGFAKSIKRMHFRGVIMVESILDVKQSLRNLRELLS